MVESESKGEGEGKNGRGGGAGNASASGVVESKAVNRIRGGATNFTASRHTDTTTSKYNWLPGAGVLSRLASVRG